MLKIYQSNPQGLLLESTDIQHNSIIYLCNPQSTEIELLATSLNIPRSFFHDCLDKNERPRIEKDGDTLLMVLNTPIQLDTTEQHQAPYQTQPFGVIHCADHLVIVSAQQLTLIEDVIAGRYGEFQSYMKTRFSLLVFKAVADSYNLNLNKINKQISHLQHQLKKSYRNHELFGLIALNKSLVYFSTALTAMNILYKRIMQGHDIKLHEPESKRLQEILVDIHQAAEVTELRRESLSNLMDAYAAIIHNNLNGVLKILTTLAIVMVIPTMIGSIFSMNVALPYEEEWFMTVLVSVSMLLIVVTLLVVFYKKKYLRTA
ncbi:magnesium transporter CorA family protein [Acinetobacter rudis]|uniref:Magnesium transporter CorA family protein n=1 Tax=Acinetobacter rudis TaxID=632955 RepID=A0AAW8JDT5_9GAMM|nr:magnesium transporter CorA family protein [Acinetobacter rudis]MDQ8937256.1 magnesium transporter CorA family protein [Acinetobacter rudis]MDQ8953989.1 magnesium transporter CorA family protein [Acinetobacter rudis]MDQ9019460.1 magnesium transporter CorA family protein [Acinetobacter rudis]